MNKMLPALIGLLLLSAPALGATNNGQFALHGVGATRCDALLRAYKADTGGRVGRDLVGWVSGYIDHANRTSPDTYDVTPVINHADLASVALNACGRNASSLFENVVSAIVDTYKPLALSQAGPTLEWKSGTRHVSVHTETALRIETFLVRQKLLETRAADGKIEPNSVAALTAWQNAKSLTPTGVPDGVTLFVMAQEMNR